MTPITGKATVSIAAHYVPERISFLAQALETMLDWPLAETQVTVVTNDIQLRDEPEIVRASAQLKARNVLVCFDVATGLAHPWHLTWWHKRHLREWVQSAGDQDLFVYIEDDIAIPAEAIVYFRKHLTAAKHHGCIPGFLRYEVAPDGQVTATDFLGPQIVRKTDLLELDGQAFVATDFPYWAGFVMDRQLAKEYLTSPWSDLDLAETMPQSAGHSCRVQSAWGLTYHNVPAQQHSRLVIPVDGNLTPLPDCLVCHTANNYVASKRHGFGTMPVGAIFQSAGAKAAWLMARWRLANHLRRVGARLKRAMS